MIQYCPNEDILPPRINITSAAISEDGLIIIYIGYVPIFHLKNNGKYEYILVTESIQGRLNEGLEPVQLRIQQRYHELYQRDYGEWRVWHQLVQESQDSWADWTPPG